MRFARERDRGSATVELAVAFPALVLLLFFALGAVNTVLERMRCVDAARDAALAAARGEDGETAGRRTAPPGAAIRVQIEDGTVRAQVTARVHPLGGYLPGMLVHGLAVADLEPGAVP